MDYYIYTIQNKVNNKIYVGQTIYPSKRWRQHKCRVNRILNGNKTAKHIQVIHRAMVKYGISNFEHQIIEKHNSRESVDEAEKFWISYLRARNSQFGYNIVSGGRTLGAGHEHPCYGRTPHNKIFTEQQEKEICNKYSNEKLSILKLSKLYSCNIRTLYGLLIRNNVKILGNKILSKGKRRSPETEFKKGIKPHNKLFTEEQEKEICRLYVEEKLSTTQIAKHYNINRRTVIIRVLNRYNIETRNAGYYRRGKTPPNKLFDIEAEKEIIKKYLNKKSFTTLGKEYNCDRTTIADILDRHNIKKRNGKLTIEDKMNIVEEYKIIKSSNKLALKYNVSKPTILKIIRESV